MHCTLTAKGRELCVAWWWGAAGEEGVGSPAARRAALQGGGWNGTGTRPQPLKVKRVWTLHASAS